MAEKWDGILIALLLVTFQLIDQFYCHKMEHTTFLRAFCLTIYSDFAACSKFTLNFCCKWSGAVYLYFCAYYGHLYVYHLNINSQRSRCMLFSHTANAFSCLLSRALSLPFSHFVEYLPCLLYPCVNFHCECFRSFYVVLSFSLKRFSNVWKIFVRCESLSRAVIFVKCLYPRALFKSSCF